MTRAQTTAPGELRPVHAGGRWHAVLGALEGGPRRMCEIRRAIDDGRHPNKVAQAKVRGAVHDLARLGLVQFIGPDWGWDLTADGRDTLTRLALAPASARRAA